MIKTTLSVAAIENGTVIDHIPAGSALSIVSILKLTQRQMKVTLGLNLPSQTLGYKDLIKVEALRLTEEEASQIAVFAPKATISIIGAYQLEKKFQVCMPSTISSSFKCQNTRCITNHEQVTTQFRVNKHGQKVQLQCHYCEKSYDEALLAL